MCRLCERGGVCGSETKVVVAGKRGRNKIRNGSMWQVMFKSEPNQNPGGRWCVQAYRQARWGACRCV